MTLTRTTTTARAQVTTSDRPVVRTAVLTTAVALAANLSVFGLARAQDVNFQFPQPGSAAHTHAVGAGAVAVVTLLAMVIGWALVRLAGRRHRPTLRTMAIVGSVVAVVSTVAPLTLDAGLSAKLTLIGLHLSAGACYVAGIVGLRQANERATR